MPRIRLTGATILDVVDDRALTGHDVVVNGGVIVAVEPAIPADRRSPDEQRIEVDGAWVLPGLIDAHSHLTLHTAAPERDELHAAAPFLSARAARANLAAGVTTCRDVGGHQHVDIELRNAIARGDVDGPRILAAGKPIVCTGGHIYYFGREADGPDEIRKAVREQLKAGADLIKVMLTGGSADIGEQPERLQLRPHELAAAVEEARAADRRVAVHAHTGHAVALAAHAGATTVEHAALLDDDGIAALLDTGCALVPTQGVYARLAANADGWPQAKADAAAAMYERKVDTLAKAVAAGVRLGVGTDSGRHFPHGEIVTEMVALADAGMPIAQLLHAATAGNAELCGLANTTGRIAVGMAADALVVDHDPRTNLERLRRPKLVMASGRVHEPAWLTRR